MKSKQIMQRYKAHATSPFKFVPFSQKQLKILTWWTDESPHKDKNGIICDGAVRSGKTLLMSYSFMLWSMTKFQGKTFGMAGKTVNSFRRNVLFSLLPILRSRGYIVEEVRTDNLIIVRKGSRVNFYYIFGGRDERSQDLVQGITLAGAFLDEVALMPESFVNQAMARCSIEGSKLWFNCNPQGPKHWFKTNFIDGRKKKKLYRLHFLLTDNPSLSKDKLEYYQDIYSGSSIFYQRYVLGLWVLSDGVIFDMWDDKEHTFDITKLENMDMLATKGSRYIAVDYGTTNPTVFLDIMYMHDGNILVMNEYYHDPKKDNKRTRDKPKQKTAKEHINDFMEFIDNSPIAHLPITQIVVDPAAAAIKLEFKMAGFRVKDADNDVLEGIRAMASLIKLGKLKCEKNNKNFLMEMGSYVWDKKKSEQLGVEAPIKMNDHAMDAMRYFCKTVVRPRDLGGDHLNE